MSDTNIFQNKNKLYSHAGKITTENFSYLLDTKSHIDKILAGKKRTKIVETDFINKEESVDYYDNQINDIEEDNIFTKEYEKRHISDLNAQRQKFFSNVKNPCTYIESKVKSKPKAKNKHKDNESKENRLSNEEKAKEELKKLMHSSNKFSYYYHLLHHTDNSNFFSENEDNSIIFGPEVNATRYNPKLEYIYPKIIYSTSFKLMSGRYDHQILSKKVKTKTEKRTKRKREMERTLRMQKLKEIVDSKLDTVYKSPTFYNEKNNEFVKNNEKIRELKRSQTLILDFPLPNKLLGDVEMEKQLKRGNLPEHHDVRIRIEKAFNTIINKGDINNLEQMANNSNTFKGSAIHDNNTIINEQSLVINKNNSNINNNSSLNNNETIYTSNALKNEIATLFNNNTINNDSNTNSNIEKNQIKNNTNNIKLNNKFLTKRIKDFQKNFKKLNLFKSKKFPDIKDPKKTMYSSSTSNIFNRDKMEKISLKMNKTTGANIFPKTNKENINTSIIQNMNSSLSNKNINRIKGVPFSKMLSRQYLDSLEYEEEPLHPLVNPKYNFIHPKCIMKVIYSNRANNNKRVKRFQGIGEEVTFDADKLYYKYNNHFPAKSFYFSKSTGRSSSVDGYLPSYLVKLGNRSSCIVFNDKSYKLNFFSEGKFNDQISSFNQHKSFNQKLNMNMINLREINRIKEENSEKFKIYRKIKEANTVRNKRRKKIVIPGQPFMSVSLKTPSNEKMPEFYRINLDSIEKNKEYFKNKIDGITLKTYIKPKDAEKLLSKREKKLFFINTNN